MKKIVLVAITGMICTQLLAQSTKKIAPPPPPEITMEAPTPPPPPPATEFTAPEMVKDAPPPPPPPAPPKPPKPPKKATGKSCSSMPAEKAMVPD